MAVNQSQQLDEVLDRAARELRDEEQPSWLELSSRILTSVRDTTRRSWPLDAQFPTAENGDTLRVSDIVVRLEVVRGVDIPGCSVTSVDLRIDGHACTGVSIGLTAEYGVDIQELARTVARLAADSVNTALGTTLTAGDVDVNVLDVSLPGE
ncbi:hypothetical protein GCM10007304_05790 [Rhodococcoides trifolii]|uniref:Asp23/Gls24 family envelope stress response protein n=1 Tax=Rhodococcoides trifolii TaxID=908250 RepID=A0A917CP02_9NOCA|nr:hypothetical protein [Rhodococcus trifolii]GGF94766.1 hypothetical protein GCM10007304_05790 [Rhodococcus trifolii]